MIGTVDPAGRALVEISIRSSSAFDFNPVEVWIDTGFNGDLVLPTPLIQALALREEGAIDAVLADGSAVQLRRYSCQIDWFDEPVELEVVSNSGLYPLLGVGLLLGRELLISYRTGKVLIQSPVG